MAVISYDELFDRLREYIDTKITESEQLLSDLFEQHNMEQIGENITEVIKVGDNIEQVLTCAMGIVPIYVCARDIHNINAAPDAAQAALTAERGAENAQRLSSGFATQAWKWAQADEDAPVYDGTHHGFSAYHWAQKAQQIASSERIYAQGNNPRLYFVEENNPNVTRDCIFIYENNKLYFRTAEPGGTPHNDFIVVQNYGTDPSVFEPAGVLKLFHENITWNGNIMWHAGNFTPSTYTDDDFQMMEGRIKELETQVKKLMMEKENGNH